MLDKKLIEDLFSEIDKTIDLDIEQPPMKFSVIAVGGTSLTLRDVKASTRDVDFMLLDIDLEKAKKYLNAVSEKKKIKIDKWSSPHVFSTTLPDDYKTDIYSKKYKHFDVLLLNLVDVAVTKISRLNDRDKDDLNAIVETSIELNEIISRYKQVLKENGFANEKEAKNNLEIFKKLFSD